MSGADPFSILCMAEDSATFIDDDELLKLCIDEDDDDVIFLVVEEDWVICDELDSIFFTDVDSEICFEDVEELNDDDEDCVIDDDLKDDSEDDCIIEVLDEPLLFKDMSFPGFNWISMEVFSIVK